MRFCRQDATIHVMNKLIDKLQKKLGKYAIRNLSMILIACYIVGYVIRFANGSLLSYLTLDPYAILHGQVWRLLTWILIPPGESSLFFILIMLYFYYSIGTALERTWGAFRYNVYIISGMIFTVISAFVMMGVMYLVRPVFYIGGMALPFEASTAPVVMSYIARVSFSTYYVNMSIFLAFAATFPEARVLLMFFIPVKIKWLGIIYAAMLAYDFFTGPFYIKVTIAASLLNFVIFYFSSVNWRRLKPSEIKRRNDFKKAVSGSRPAAAGPRNGGSAPGGGPVRITPAVKQSIHRCTVCGRTENDSPDLEFRYCSKCEGSHEYCQDHLFTHVHIRNSQTDGNE